MAPLSCCSVAAAAVHPPAGVRRHRVKSHLSGRRSRRIVQSPRVRRQRRHQALRRRAPQRLRPHPHRPRRPYYRPPPRRWTTLRQRKRRSPLRWCRAVRTTSTRSRTARRADALDVLKLESNIDGLTVMDADRRQHQHIAVERMESEGGFDSSVREHRRRRCGTSGRSAGHEGPGDRSAQSIQVSFISLVDRRTGRTL